MASLRNGIMGMISGTVGNIVVSSWKGVPYVRSRPKYNKSRCTRAQKAQRLKFKEASKFVNAFKSLLAITFKDPRKRMTELNYALSYNIRNAITGNYPTYHIDYEKALVAIGMLYPAGSPVATPTASSIDFKWSFLGSNYTNSLETDKVLLVAYHAPSNNLFFTIGPATRNAGKASLALPGLKGKKLETWIAFISENGKLVSKSEYTGTVKLG